jgi:hypothetical protein
LSSGVDQHANFAGGAKNTQFKARISTFGLNFSARGMKIQLCGWASRKINSMGHTALKR